MYKYIAIIIIIIILFSIFYIKHNINIWIHNRQVRPFILKIINHPLYDAYKYSLYLEYNKKHNILKNNSGFNRITPLINAPNKLYNVNDLMQEINNIIIYKNHERLGDSLAHSGKKKSWQLRLFNTDTIYTKLAPKCIKLVDKISNELNCEAISISLAYMYPNTWLKYHEGFWGYGEYITRCMLGVKCADYGCGLHVYNESPLTIKKGKVISFDDCKMHEAWNLSNENRIVLIFDLWNNEGFSNNKNALNEIKTILNNRLILTEEDKKRKQTSLRTIQTIKKQIM